ncbi:MAG: methyltransferase domain-containing protein, partial [Chitinophagaceae bacterium]
KFEYTHSEKLGDAFEYLLSVMGSQGDAGQFRTPRHIIDFIVAIVNPGKKDTILDPACGTAGFLISAFNHIRHKNKKGLTPDERKKLIQNFTGYDISPDMVRLSLVNLYLHGFSDPHIYEYDTLSSEERWNDSFDVILANPPFMSPKGGIRPHKKFTISSNRSEVLFMDYIAEHLNPKGRAGVIVPEGVIFQSGSAYKQLRKMLVENYLYAVVSLPAGVFNPYSGVKTSILLMDKALAKKSDKILFVKIDNDGYNLGAQRTAVKGSQLEEATAVIDQFKEGEEFQSSIANAVLKTEISANGEFNLSGSRYLVNEVLQTEFERVALEDVLDYEHPTNYIVENEEYDDSYKTPVLTAGKSFILGYTNEEIGVFNNPLPVIIFDDFTTATQYVNFPFKVKSSAMKILKAKKNANITFLYYLMQHIKFDSSDHKRYWISQYSKIKIPLPSLSVQEEIVIEIESYQQIIDGAKAVVNNYKPKINIDPKWEMGELGENCKIKSGNAFKSRDYVDEGVQLIRMGNVKQMFFDRENSPSYLPPSYLNEYPNYVLVKGDLLISMTGTVGKEDYGNVCQIDKDEQFLLNQRVGKFEIQTDDLDRQYLYFVAQTDYFRKQLFANSAGGVRQANISNKGIESISIPLPNIETQRQIVAQIEKEQELVNANKQLIEIFEQKIKDRIAKVWGE